MNPKDASVLIIDGGQFFSLAQALAPHFKRCYFGGIHDPCYPIPNGRMIGDGFDGITCVKDPLEIASNMDLIVIPDVGLASLTHFLRKETSLVVWGSGDGQVLETDRVALKEWQRQKGLDIPKWDLIIGLPALADTLRNRNGKECFIKWSFYRGLGETYHFTGWEEARPWLNGMAVKLGPVSEVFEFMIEEPIETEIETGIDAPFAQRWPKRVQHAVEAKDKGCIATITKFDELPAEVLRIARELEAYLSQQGYMNFASFEARITDDGTAIMNDFTARMATPCGETMIRNISNLAEVVMRDAMGFFVEPEWSSPFSAQAMIDCSGDEEEWRVVRIDKEAQPHICLYCPIQIDDELFAFPPLPYSTETIGSIVTRGDSIKGCVDQIKEVAEMIPNLTVKMDGIQSALSEVKEMEKKDVPFTDAPIPKPEVAL